MERKPITKVIVWTGGEWVDQETGVRASGLGPPIQREEQPLDEQQKQPPQWAATLDERMNKHIVFARDYAKRFAHGAPGHLDLMTIAALAKMLDEREPSAKGYRLPDDPAAR
jgi:hypothetical protein